MKTWALATLALGLLALSLFYRGVSIETKLTCQQTLTSLSEQSEALRKAAEDKNHAIETQRVKAEQAANERSRLLAERLQRDKPRASDNPDKPARRIPADAYGVLREAASDDRLPEAPDPTIPTNTAIPAPNAGQ